MILNSKILGADEKKIIILHGFLGSLDNWVTFAKKLSNNGYEVHLIDQRNHGKSFHSDDFNYELMANDLYKYLNEKNINKTSILGHSMGGKTAMLYSLMYPDTINKLIVVDILPVNYNTNYDETFEALLEIDLKEIKSRNDFNIHLNKHFDDPNFILFLSKNLQRTSDGGFNFKSNIKVLYKKYKNITAGFKFINQFKNEVLFIKGEKSKYINPYKLKLSEMFFPNYKLQKIRNAGHWVHYENPNDFFLVCSDYLNN